MSIVQDHSLAKLPAKGTLFVASDLQGHFRDFESMIHLFEAEIATSPDTYLLFLGDLIHGVRTYDQKTWPKWLGPYYDDQSTDILNSYLELEQKYPGHCLSLLGSHEHAHIGGIWLAGDCELFEESAGPHMNTYMDLFFNLPVAAIAPCGIVFTHASPSLNTPYSAAEIAAIDTVTSYQELSIPDMIENEAVQPLGTLIWSRIASKQEADIFLKGISDNKNNYYLSV